MVRDKRRKNVHCEGFRPTLFDLETDPLELYDLGADPAYEVERARFADAIFTWARKHHRRITVAPERVNQMAGREPRGILIGYWDEKDYEGEFGRPFKRNEYKR